MTGVETVRIMSSIEDNMDRLLVSFKDAKVSFISVSKRRQVDRIPPQIALMEWSEVVHDLLTVSIHTYERAPQMVCVFTPDFMKPHG